MSVETDVATVLALSEPAEALLKAIKAAQPAIERLEDANYPGAEAVCSETGPTLEGDLTAGELIVTGSLYEIVATLEVFRKAGGDLGAADYHYQVGRLGQSVAEAAAELLDYAHDDAHVQRVVGLQRYAATVA
jgi:hypothetical protein